LEERRHQSDLIELFKMARGLSAIPLTDFFKFSTRPFGSTTRGHSWKLIKAHSNTDTRLLLLFFPSPESMEQFTAGGSQLEHCQHLQGAFGKNRLTLMLFCASTYTM